MNAEHAEGAARPSAYPAFVVLLSKPQIRSASSYGHQDIRHDARDAATTGSSSFLLLLTTPASGCKAKGSVSPGRGQSASSS